jgi:hypothetical protein
LTLSFIRAPPLSRKVESSKFLDWCCPSTPPRKARRGCLLAHQCERQGASLLALMFFFPLVANIVVCAKFDMKKKGRATMCSCSPRKRRRQGGKEGGGEEVEMKRRR